MSLPLNVCLKSEKNKKYLRCHKKDGAQSPGFLQFSGDNPFDISAQFEVVHAKKGNGMIHLKSRHTNKYFRREDSGHRWIQPVADEPNENEKEWSCTLFKPEIIEDNGTIKKARLMHVQLGHYACLWFTYTTFLNLCLYVPTTEPIAESTFEIINFVDLSSISKLPKNVAFKGDNGNYLGEIEYKGKSLLQFSFDDPKDPNAAYEVMTSSDDAVYIKTHYDKFWRVDEDGMIVPDGLEKSGDVFRVDFIDVNVVALFNVQKEMYCKRYTSKQHGVDLLRAITSSVDNFAKLQVMDLGE